MAADRVETLWHLTLRGWEQGQDNTTPPSDRVLTIVDVTVWPSQWDSKKTTKHTEERWRSNDKAEVEELLTKFPRFTADWKPLR
jgi:hypothetical protein